MKKFTSKEVCEVLNITYRGLQKWIYEGIYVYENGKRERRKLIPSFPSSGCGSKYLFTYEDFDKFFNEQRKEHYKLGLNDMKYLDENYIEKNSKEITNNESREYWLNKLNEATELMQECIRQLRRWE